MGLLFLISLAPAGGAIYRCKHCDAHLAYVTDVLSKSFRCKHGKAYLLDKVVNVDVGERDDRMMTTGLHTVCDIFCVGCGSILGWKYVAAFDKTQRYKEGKFILERCKVSGPPGRIQQAWAEQDARASESDEDDQDATYIVKQIERRPTLRVFGYCSVINTHLEYTHAHVGEFSPAFEPSVLFLVLFGDQYSFRCVHR